MGLILRVVRAVRSQWAPRTQRPPAPAPWTAEQVLEKVIELWVGEWNYDFDPPNTRRCGPIAQEFFKAFQYGTSDRSIPVESAIGVLFVCVQQIAREQAALRAAPSRPPAARRPAPTPTLEI